MPYDDTFDIALSLYELPVESLSKHFSGLHRVLSCTRWKSFSAQPFYSSTFHRMYLTSGANEEVNCTKEN